MPAVKREATRTRLNSSPPAAKCFLEYPPRAVEPGHPDEPDPGPVGHGKIESPARGQILAEDVPVCASEGS